mmetsp:Transcript_81588/g.231223  ORF Transcript_81588/g.231223 Transcript_81588/m.231223 type:complete len:230 (-) Transcript_81588:441-1130(-)
MKTVRAGVVFLSLSDAGVAGISEPDQLLDGAELAVVPLVVPGHQLLVDDLELDGHVTDAVEAAVDPPNRQRRGHGVVRLREADVDGVTCTGILCPILATSRSTSGGLLPRARRRVGAGVRRRPLEVSTWFRAGLRQGLREYLDALIPLLDHLLQLSHLLLQRLLPREASFRPLLGGVGQRWRCRLALLVFHPLLGNIGSHRRGWLGARLVSCVGGPRNGGVGADHLREA